MIKFIANLIKNIIEEYLRVKKSDDIIDDMFSHDIVFKASDKLGNAKSLRNTSKRIGRVRKS